MDGESWACNAILFYCSLRACCQSLYQTRTTHQNINDRSKSTKQHHRKQVNFNCLSQSCQKMSCLQMLQLAIDAFCVFIVVFLCFAVFSQTLKKT
jgi:hypothetical protein